jgi:alcohol dehydrogenase
MIDPDDNRLAVAKSMGATKTINNRNEMAVEKVLSFTENKGVDVAIEAVGIPETFELCQSLVAAGGVIANVGVHGKPVDLHLEQLWGKNITITTRLVDTVSTPMLMKTVQSGRLNSKQLITHHFKLFEIIEAYECFGHAAKEKTLKVILTND